MHFFIFIGFAGQYIQYDMVLQAAGGGEALTALHSGSSGAPTPTTKSSTDGLLANLQERLVQTESGISIVSTNTDLRTLADLATMSSDKPTTVAAGLMSHNSAVGSMSSSNGDTTEASPQLNNSNHADSIAKAFNRSVIGFATGLVVDLKQVDICVVIIWV